VPEHETKNSKNQPQNQSQQSKSNPAPHPMATTILEQYEPIIDSTATKVYETSLKAPIRLKVLDKFGVGRSAIFRSKELNAFRQKLKDTAREQARDDVAENLNTTFTANENLKKAKHSMLANSSVYKDAKVSVDDIMGQEADKILQSVLPSEKFTPFLKSAARSSFQSNASHEKKMKSILDKAQERADELYKPLEEMAVNRARYIVKGIKGVPDTSGREGIVTEIGKNVQQNVKDREIGKKAVEASITVPSFDSALTKIAPLIKQVVPYAGDSAELSLEIKIPIPPSGFISIHLGASAEHDDDHYQLGVEVNIGGGGTFKVAELKGSVGLFIEAKGTSEMAALNLMSYGLYRHMYVLSPTIATTLWGLGGKTGYSKLEEAEIWAAVIEQQLTDDSESYVSVGQQAAFDATVKTGIYEGEFQLKGQRTTTYNKENLDGLNSDEHLNKQVAKLNKDSVPTRLLQLLRVKEADPNKKTYKKEDIQAMTFGENIDLGYITAREKQLQPGEKLTDIKKDGKDSLERRSKRYKEIEANKSLSITTEHTLSLPHGKIELGGSFSFSSSEISGEISFGFPEELKKLKGDSVFNHLFPKLTSITNSAVQLLVFNSDEKVTNVNDYEGLKILTANTIQSVIASQELEGALEDLHGTSITGTLEVKYDLEKKKLEIELVITKDTSHEIKHTNKLDLDVVNFNYSKSSKIAAIKKEVTF